MYRKQISVSDVADQEVLWENLVFVDYVLES